MVIKEKKKTNDILFYLISLDSLCSDINDIETALITEIGDVISSTDYSPIFSNCCNILRYLF